MYLELIALSTDAAGQPWLLDQLLHLLQQGSLGHHLTLLIGLKHNTSLWRRLRTTTTTTSSSLNADGTIITVILYLLN